MRNFMEMLHAKWDEGKFVCVGLDSDPTKIPESVGKGTVSQEQIVEFNSRIIDATRDLVCAYKPNIAFYATYGIPGWHALRNTIDWVNQVAPEIPVILDAKRADIGNTNRGYVAEVFDVLGADAVTVNPYFGAEALQPFLERKDKGIIVLCRTSNKGAGEFQDLTVLGQGPLYRVVAQHVASEWNKNGNCALVIGATYPAELAEVRGIVGDGFPILIPGIGKQGGDLEKTVNAGRDSKSQGMIINSSSGIIFASDGEDFAEAARRETEKLHNGITQILKGAVTT